MVRVAFLILGVVAMAASGCCGPRGCGIGCSTGCGDCGSASISSCGCGGPSCGGGGPLSAIRNARRGLICGSGCGESYVGEWISTPPDCNDPCCGDQFVGGAVKARPFCRQRGGLLRSFYGTRTCSGSESSVDCGCGGSSCDTCSAGDYGYADNYQIIGDYSESIHSGVQEGGCGCSTCKASSPMASRLATMGRHPIGNSITASTRSKQTTQRAQQIRR